MNEKQARLMVIAELARDIYTQLLSRYIPYANQDTRVKLAEIAHNTAVDFMAVQEKWVSSHDAIIQPASFMPDLNGNDDSSDIFMGGDFNA
ncbi:hypothetical protein B9T07_26395 [Limnospira fusiformis CCALA 023]|uniref:hypothetical protein n=1 Tax=Limnospira platensis TaxID=118562 RepID=UPI00396EA86F